MTNVINIKTRYTDWYIKQDKSGMKVIEKSSFHFDDVKSGEEIIWKPNNRDSYRCVVTDKVICRDDETNEITAVWVDLLYVKKDGSFGKKQCHLQNEYKGSLEVGNWNRDRRSFNVLPKWR